ncbi:hypothetical protein [Haloarchaeobius sp. HRN-SO-5]|uniref:hypothetical protein n=1 Tax=Haloarchaeobius sp. HRN-SO-5 TaxID=3446118 RepID=UPI003EB97332
MLLVVLLQGLVLQGLPPEVAAAMDDVLGTITPTNAAMYGAGGLFSVAGVRWLVKRRAGGTLESAATGTTVNTGGGTASKGMASTTTTTTTRASGSKHNVAFTLPSFLPVSDGIRNVTHHEIHAVELGLVVGLASTWLYVEGRTEVVTGIVVAFVAGSLGYRRYSSKAFKTIRYEPWYALLALAAGGALGFGLFVMEPSLLSLVNLLALP